MATDGTDFPLEAAHPGLAGETLDDEFNGRARDVALGLGEPGFFQAPRDEEARSDFELFLSGVTGQVNHLEAVAQGRRNGRQHIGRANEEHTMQVEGHTQVVVAKAVVLLGVEDLEQGRRRIAANALAELVHLVQHEDRVVGPGAPQTADHIAGQGAHIGTAVTTNLGLVMDAAEADSYKLALHGPRYAPAEGSLAHPRRAHQAQAHALAIGLELPHGEELDDALLDLLQAEMVLAQDARSGLDVEPIGAALRPGQLNHDFEEGAHYGGLGGAIGHAFEAREFLAGLLFGLFGHLGLFNGQGQRLDLRRLVIRLAQLAADGAQLFAQVVLALGLLEGALGFVADLFRESQDLGHMTEFESHEFEALAHIKGLEHLLAFLHGHIHEGRHHVRQHRRRADILHRHGQVFLGTRGEAQNLASLFLEGVKARLDIGVFFVEFRLLDDLDASDGQRILGHELDHATTLFPLADGVVATIVSGDVAHHLGHGAHGVEVCGGRHLHRFLALQEQSQGRLGAHGFLDGLDRPRPTNHQRQNHAREEHHVAHRHDEELAFGQGIGVAPAFCFRLSRGALFCGSLARFFFVFLGRRFVFLGSRFLGFGVVAALLQIVIQVVVQVIFSGFRGRAFRCGAGGELGCAAL